jgi:hypothetical protein
MRHQRMLAQPRPTRRTVRAANKETDFQVFTHSAITHHVTLHCPDVAWQESIRHELHERLSTYTDMHPAKLLAPD